MKPFYLGALFCVLLAMGCSGPTNSGFDSQEQQMAYLFAWNDLKVYSIFQEKLPSDPYLYTTPKSLFSSLGDRWTAYYTIEEAIAHGLIEASVAQTRANTPQPTVYWDTLDRNIGYIALIEFAENTAAELQTILEDTKDFPVRVLDLRQNPGGYIDVCDTICAEFLHVGDTLVRTHTRDINTAANPPYPYTHDSIITSYKTGSSVNKQFVLLVDTMSASAAEIFTAAIKVNRRDIPILGSRTYGKGRGQVLFRSFEGGVAKITFATFTTADNEAYDNRVGIIPDSTYAPDTDWLVRAHLTAKRMAGTLGKESVEGQEQVQAKICRIEAVHASRVRPGRELTAWRKSINY